MDRNRPYDRKRRYRMPPDLMAYVDRAVLAYRAETSGLGGVAPDPGDLPAASGHDTTERPGS